MSRERASGSPRSREALICETVRCGRKYIHMAAATPAISTVNIRNRRFIVDVCNLFGVCVGSFVRWQTLPGLPAGSSPLQSVAVRIVRATTAVAVAAVRIVWVTVSGSPSEGIVVTPRTPIIERIAVWIGLVMTTIEVSIAVIVRIDPVIPLRVATVMIASNARIVSMFLMLHCPFYWSVIAPC